MSEKVKIDELEEFDAGGVDLEQFEGQKVEIETVEVVTVKTPWSVDGQLMEKDEEGNQKTRDTEVLKVSSATVTTVNDRDGNEVEIRASELFNLVEKEGKWGYSKSPKAKIQKFMSKQKVSTPLELIATKALIRTRENKKGDTFLGFVV